MATALTAAWALEYSATAAAITASFLKLFFFHGTRPCVVETQ